MQCPRCNTTLVAGARFCGVCGNVIPAQDGNGPQVALSDLMSAHNDATLAVDLPPDVQLLRDPQTARQNAPAQQGPFPPSPAAPWPQQPTQPVSLAANAPQTAWSPGNGPQGAYPPGRLPRTVSSAGTRPARRRRRWPLRVLLVLLVLLTLLAGGWFLGVRPYLNDLAKTQINKALNDAQSQLLILQFALPAGPRTIPVTENDINNYLQGHTTDPLQDLHMTIATDGLHLDFKVYSFACAISAVPIASNGGLQVTNVQVQGPLALILSSDDVTTLLDDSFSNFGQQMHRKVDAIVLHDHRMEMRIH
ncbi:MAG TPA: hypothetical protein VFV38_40820 [Ktedonobacteraceae bacterium]|nr:hypothetical protein [Ktedonobacteraceae bacterium]